MGGADYHAAHPETSLVWTRRLRRPWCIRSTPPAGLRARPGPRAGHRGGAHQLSRCLQRATARPSAGCARRPRRSRVCLRNLDDCQKEYHSDPFLRSAATTAGALASPAAAPDLTAAPAHAPAAASGPASLAAPAFKAFKLKPNAAELDDKAEITSVTANFQLPDPRSP
jgi:hypothetical protein